MPYVTEHQIIALATRSSRAFDLTREVEVDYIPDGLRASEQSWPHFGLCVDLRVDLPNAISALRNMTRFRWHVHGYEPAWLFDLIVQTVIHLP